VRRLRLAKTSSKCPYTEVLLSGKELGDSKMTTGVSYRRERTTYSLKSSVKKCGLS
jgi:hypothetical protein